MIAVQLDLNGDERPLPTPNRDRGLTRSQHAILHHLAEHGIISSTQAGIIIHGHRPMPAYLERRRNELHHHECPRAAAKRLLNIVPAAAASNHWPSDRALACCPWSATDGLYAMKRLAARGLVTNHPERKGQWVRTGDTL